MAQGQNRENFWVSLGVNIVLPTLILMKAQKWLAAAGLLEKDAAKPIYFFLAALALPLAYGIWDLAKKRKFSLFAALGILNVLLTGTIGLFELSREWIIAKEAGIPALLGLAVLISAYTPRPLAGVLVYNDAILDTQKVGAALEERGNSKKFSAVLKTATILVSASFFASAAIQFFLARAIYTEGASPEEFNAQVGRMTWISFFAVMLPCMLITCAAFVKIANAIKNLAGLDFEEALAPDLREAKK